MAAYILRRLLLMIPTLLGILLLNFAIVQFAPGGPVERVLAQLQGQDVGATARVAGSSAGETSAADPGGDNRYRGSQGLPPDLVADLERQFGFDRPAHERFLIMLADYARLDFGESFYQDRTVLQLIGDKLPVSVSLGLWTTLLVYLISIPLGIKKAVRDGTPFDFWTSTLVIIGNAVPSFLFAVLLVVLFAGGSFLDWFPLQGLVSENWADLSWPARIVDYFWHITLPVLAMVIGGFASLTMLTKNSFLEEINKQYVTTARAKGLSEHRVLYGHVFRNAMLVVIAGFPAAFVGILFTGSLLIEIIFSLDGLGLLGYEAVINRDYPVIFGTLFIYTLVGLLLNLIGDLAYVAIDPRIDFEAREG
ncbi:microcin C ABC transporter permease YejB [Alkalilimnicola sp. S0819]|uniref:microcin C ABC transporter permease YejB n=1 Tax=Alkalilimnicola sp. S0819 TaxID=2613922 RepID=UPI001261FFE1|nr:microcin C ABC transporter permease YejB [Alkalilimnicola sp. S0819]KAB7628376.1 microcin C ABC transporter permease YejB [Alkalilimnicola sp. S0819]MPQ15279.1 microcin C ABC transporter permease YejB [Alkalilimnicola sp. S0819]